MGAFRNYIELLRSQLTAFFIGCEVILIFNSRCLEVGRVQKKILKLSKHVLGKSFSKNMMWKRKEAAYFLEYILFISLYFLIVLKIICYVQDDTDNSAVSFLREVCGFINGAQNYHEKLYEQHNEFIDFVTKHVRIFEIKS